MYDMSFNLDRTTLKRVGYNARKLCWLVDGLGGVLQVSSELHADWSEQCRPSLLIIHHDTENDLQLSHTEFIKSFNKTKRKLASHSTSTAGGSLWSAEY
jgi:hypothetical protein